MRRIAFISYVVLAVIVASAQQYNVPFRPRAAAGGGTTPSQVGTTLQYVTATTNTGTVSASIDVPATATFVVVGVSGYAGSANYYSGGGMTMLKAASPAAMTVAITGTGSGDESASTWGAAMFYMVAPDTGTNTLEWDWAGTAASVDVPLVSITFWKDVHQTTPVGAAVGGQGATNTPYTTSSITVATDDLLVAWVGAYCFAAAQDECNCTSWSGVTELYPAARFLGADGAWATTTTAGTATRACSTDSSLDDGGIVAITVKPL